MLKRSLLAATALAAVIALPAFAQSDDDVTQSAAASRDSAVSSTKLAAAGVQLVAGIAFAPVRRTLSDSNRAAEVAGESGKFANDSADGKLEVSPETIQAQPAPNVPYDTRDTNPANSPDNATGNPSQGGH